MPNYILRLTLLGLVSLAAISLTAACAGSQSAQDGHPWPNLADIKPAPAKTVDEASVSLHHDSVIKALRDEAEARKDEGYQAPQPVKNAGISN